MHRRLFAVFTLLAAACVLAACAAPGHAQDGGRRGRGGRGGFGRFGRTTHQLQLATLPEVEAELKLTDEQKTAIADLNDQFDDERRDQFGGGEGGGFSPEALAARVKLNALFAAKLNEALEEPQQKRIQEIYIQVNGTSVLTDEAVAAALALTDEQKQGLLDVLDDQRQAMQDAFQDWQSMSDEEQQTTTGELNKARNEALLAVLTDEQKTQFEALKGATIEVDLSPLRRGRFGGGGRRGGDGGGDDGGNDNGGDDASGRPAADDDGA